VGPAVEGKRTWWPQAGHAYSLTPRCRNGVRHFGHGIGFALTHAANSSWERRSTSAGGASDGVATAGPGGGARGAVEAEVARAEGVPVRTEESRPHWGQTARLPEPVDWSGTRQLGQSVFNPEGVKTGAGATGGRPTAEGSSAGAGVGEGAGGGRIGNGRAHRTVRRPGS
jgi:hypothetical protein